MFFREERAIYNMLLFQEQEQDKTRLYVFTTNALEEQIKPLQDIPSYRMRVPQHTLARFTSPVAP